MGLASLREESHDGGHCTISVIAHIRYCDAGLHDGREKAYYWELGFRCECIGTVHHLRAAQRGVLLARSGPPARCPAGAPRGFLLIALAIHSVIQRPLRIHTSDITLPELEVGVPAPEFGPTEGPSFLVKSGPPNRQVSRTTARYLAGRLSTRDASPSLTGTQTQAGGDRSTVAASTR